MFSYSFLLMLKFLIVILLFEMETNSKIKMFK